MTTVIMVADLLDNYHNTTEMINRILITGIGLLCAIHIYAQDYKAKLIGYNQSLPVITEAIGVISADYDGQFLRIEGRVDNLEGTFQLDFNDGISLYRGTQGTKGEKVASMLPFVDSDGHGFDLIEVANRFELTPEEVLALNNNELYINVGTDLHPDGEIRAQIVPVEAEVYYCTLLGSGVTHPYPTRGQGSVMITKVADSISISGSFRNLEGSFDITDINAASLRSEYAGTDGILLSNLIVESDTVANAGVIRNTSNKYKLNASESINLADGGLYVNIISEKYDKSELRGQATLAVKQMYVANLRSYNAMPFNNSRATGKILIQRNHGDSLYLSGSFQGLESRVAIDFAGGTIMYDGAQGQVGTVQQLLVPSLAVGSRFGAFHSDDNFFQYIPEDLQKLDDHGFHIIIHSEDRFNGEIRGQVMPIGQNNFSIVMNDIQTKNGNVTGYKAFLDAIQLDDQISFSGSLLDSISGLTADALSLKSGLPGKTGSQVLQLTMDEDENANYTMVYPNANTYTIDEALLQNMFDRNTYMDISDAEGEEVIRGQMIPTLQSIYYVPLSDRQTVHHHNSDASGMMIVEQHYDSELRVIGSFENLGSDLDDAITGNILLHEGKYGIEGPAFRALIAVVDADKRGGEILAEDNIIFIQNSIADSLQISGLYISVNTEDESGGEIRGQTLELADAYYNTRLHATNVVTSSIASGKGQLLGILKNQKVSVVGSFEELDGVVNFSNNGGVSIREAAIDQNGDIKFLLFPEYDVDSLSGVFERSNNTLFLSEEDLSNMNSENFYIEMRKTSQDGPALRGQLQAMKNTSPAPAVILSPENRDTILIDGLVTSRLDFEIESDPNNTTSLRISDRPDFLPTLYARNFGYDEDITLNYTIIDDLLDSLDQQIGDTIRLYYQVVKSDGADYNNGQLQSMNLIRGILTGVPDIFKAHLTANHSVPPRQSTGYGQILAELLDSTLRISGSIVGLMGEIENMHVHMGMAGTNGPAILPLMATVSSDGNSAQLTAFDNTYELTAAQLDTLNDRGLYINVHTSLFPSGEVRGQILPEANAYYYANLLGSNTTDPYLTEAAGALSIEVRDGEMTITGTYHNLESPYDFNIQGGSHLKLGLPGEDGPSLFTLIPIEMDSVSGTYQAQSNTFDFTATDLTILESRNMYADIHTIERPNGAIRGMITPMLKGIFRANLGSIHHHHIMNDHARGTVQVDLDVNNDIGLYGVFSDLSSSTNDFDGLINYRYGFDDDVRDILSINANFNSQDSTAGSFLFGNNVISADENTVRELMLRSHHINVDLNEGFGGVRGQILGLAQQYLFAKMNGYQMMPSQGGGSIKTAYIERVDNNLQFSGAVGSESSTISLYQDLIGNEGSQIVSFAGNEVNGDYLLDPYQASIAVDDSLDDLMNSQATYLQHDNASNGMSQRGQVVKNARYIHLGLVSGIGQLRSIDTDAEGRAMLVSKWDDTYSFTGAVKNLTGGLNTDIAGGMHLHIGLPGDNGDIETIITSVANDSDYNVEENVINSTIQFDSLQSVNALYFNVHSVDFPNGEIRSQMRPLSNYYYTTTLNGKHVIDDSNSDALGKIYLDVSGNRSTYYGSYRGLSFPINGASTASAIGFNFVYENFIANQNLEIVVGNSNSGEWIAEDNMQITSQNTFDGFENKLAHIAVSDVFDNVALRGRLLEEINQFPNASDLSPSTPNDTLLIEGILTDAYTSTWTNAIDDEDLMYKIQISTSPVFLDVIYEGNTLDQNTFTISFVQLQSALASAGVMSGDTLDLYQRVYVTDGSEDTFGNVSSFTAINGLVEEPIESYRVYLSGYQQTSPVTSRGQGSVDIMLQGNVMTVEGSFEGMESSIADQLNGGAHIQIGLAGEDGPIMYSLNVDSGADESSGNINEFENIFEITNEELEIIKRKEAYISIYSDRYSTGELRGQILPIADDYFISALTTSQMLDPDYSLDVGQIVMEIYSDSIWITGAIHHSTNENTNYALYVGLAGQEGQKIINLNAVINLDGGVARFESGNNQLENTAGLLALIENREVYIATSSTEGVLNLRGQILPEIRSAFYAHLSGLKTTSISNSLSQGRVIMELGEEDVLSFTGNVAGLEKQFSDMMLHLGLPGMDGDIVGPMSAIQSMDLENYSLIAQNNTLTITDEILDAVIARELYLQVNTDDELVGEVRGQFMAMAPIYAESIITGSQISADRSSQAHGIVEMEIHPQEMNALGSISGLPLEIDDVDYLNASAALEGDLLGSMIWQNPNDGVATMSLEDNRRLYNAEFVDDMINNRISIRVSTPEYTLGAARGILMPLAQGLYVAPLSGATLRTNTINSGAGIAMLVLRNDTEIKFVAGIDAIPTNSLRFRFGKGYPGVVDDNPFNFLGFQPNGTGGVIYNNNNINNFTSQIINDIRAGLHHVKISSSSNNSFVDHVRGQMMPIGYQSYQGTFTDYHPQGATDSDDFGKVKATLNGTRISLEGNISLDGAQVTSAWIGVGGVNDDSVPIYPIAVIGEDMPLQSVETFGSEDIASLANKELHIVIATDEYPDGAVRAQLMPDINYYPAAVTIDNPVDGASIIIEGDSSQILTIDWVEIESPDPLKYVWILSRDQFFQDILLKVDRKDNDFISFTYAQMDSLLREDIGLDIGDATTVYHQVVTTDGSEDVSSEIYELTLTLDELVSVAEISIAGLEDVKLMPNLTYGGSTTLYLELTNRKDLSLDILGIDGKLMYNTSVQGVTGNQSINLAVNHLSAGKYQVILSDTQGGKVVLDWIVMK